MPTRRRKSYMTPEDFRRLRESTGLSPTALAYVLDCGQQSVRNMENGSAAIGRQMAMLITLVAHPLVYAMLPEVFHNRDRILSQAQKTS